MTAKILTFEPSPGDAPTPQNGQTPPKRVRNSEVRTREYLTPDEVDALMKAAKKTNCRAQLDEEVSESIYVMF